MNYDRMRECLVPPVSPKPGSELSWRMAAVEHGSQKFPEVQANTHTHTSVKRNYLRLAVATRAQESLLDVNNKTLSSCAQCDNQS